MSKSSNIVQIMCMGPLVRASNSQEWKVVAIDISPADTNNRIGQHLSGQSEGPHTFIIQKYAE